ncbi:hypothetical protein FRC01_011004, partial [Tulasnella sp. 417]
MVVSTRRKSGKLKEVNYAEDGMGDDAASDGMESTPHNSQHQEDSDGSEDYEFSHGKKRKPRKPVVSTTPGKRKGKARKLDTLFDKLPIEVVYNILAFLHPQDLLRLARTNQMLRSHLMSKTSISIWKEARENLDPPVPKCPPDQSEPQWARLLFTRECSNCDKNNIPNVDWVHRLRLCNDCSRAGIVLIIGTKVQKTFPDVEDVPSLLSLLPWSMMGSSRRGGRYYRISDVEKFSAQLANIKDRNEIEEFNIRRINQVREIVDSSLTFGAWDRKRTSQKRKDKMDTKESRKQEIWASAFSSTAKLTESRWNVILPQLEAVANNAKTERLEREYQGTVNSRDRLAEALVREYYATSTIRPAFRHRSCVRDMISSKIFQDVIHQPADVTVAKEDFQEALKAVPELALKASREIQLYLLQLMVKGGASDIDTSETGSSSDILVLPTATFFCKSNINGLPHCGVAELDEHTCFPIPGKPKFYCLSYDHRAGSAVAGLLGVAGLDPTTAAEQMDEKNLRFSCSRFSNGSSRLAMSWRDAASHAKTIKHGGDNDWELFSTEETEVIKEREKANILDVRYRFRCVACYFPAVYRREQLESHLSN